MMRKFIPLLLLLLIPVLLGAANYHKSPTVKVRDIAAPVLRGDEVSVRQPVYPPYNIPYGPYDDIIGDTLVIGTTWYENQHNGTIGRMLDISDDGYIHFVWMKGYDSAQAQRHVWYNAAELSSNSLSFLDGVVVDASSRAGFTTVDADQYGVAFPAFHQVTTDPAGNPHTALAFDIGPHTGAFTAFDAPWLFDEFGTPMEIIWPHMMFSNSEETMHVISTEYAAAAGDPQRQFYTPGSYDPLSYSINYPELPDSALRMIGWTMTIAGDVASSPVSDRVMFAWTYPLNSDFPNVSVTQRDNDVYVLIDDDGQDFHFEDYFNLTNFFPPDFSYYPDTSLMLMDTLRAYTDLNVFIDQDDYAHVVFTTPHYNAIDSTSYWNTSIIWHWTEQYPNEFQMIHNAFDDWWEGWYAGESGWGNVYCGAWNVKAQRPQLAQDPNTGDLYCMYQVYDCDTTHLSAFVGSSGWGMPSGEIYMSKSLDGGLTWSQGIDVTNTITPMNAAPGQSLSELTPSLCKVTTAEFAHVLYVLDRDAGNTIQTEGDPTDNPVIYHRVPLDQIPATPLVEQTVPFHVDQAPQVGVPGATHLMQPKEFGLKQNYPNPFNPTTTISFSLDQVSEISLNVYSLKGELVANVASGTFGTGEHSIQFDGSALASGMYFYKLQAGQRTMERKMLLLK